MKIVRSAKIVILDADGKALLLKRSATHPREPFAPDLPGGIIENGESMEEGLVRELREETGIDVSESKLTLLYTLTYDTIPDVSISRLLYVTWLSEVSPSVRLSYEHSEYKWVEVSDLVGLETPYQEGVDYAHQNGLWVSSKVNASL